MPNIKIYVDDTLSRKELDDLYNLAVELQTLLCTELHVETDACQMAFIPFRGVAGQAEVNVEIVMLQGKSRNQKKLEDLAGLIRHVIAKAVSRRISVRCQKVAPADYVTLR